VLDPCCRNVFDSLVMCAIGSFGKNTTDSIMRRRSWDDGVNTFRGDEDAKCWVDSLESRVDHVKGEFVRLG
jgi:hypothetical protein